MFAHAALTDVAAGRLLHDQRIGRRRGEDPFVTAADARGAVDDDTDHVDATRRLDEPVFYPFECAIAGIENAYAIGTAGKTQLLHVMLDVLARGQTGRHATEKQFAFSFDQTLAHLFEKMRRREIHGLYTAQIQQQVAPLIQILLKFREQLVGGAKKQTALQESESTSYVIGVMSDAINYDELPQI